MIAAEAPERRIGGLTTMQALSVVGALVVLSWGGVQVYDRVYPHMPRITHASTEEVTALITFLRADLHNTDLQMQGLAMLNEHLHENEYNRPALMALCRPWAIDMLYAHAGNSTVVTSGLHLLGHFANSFNNAEVMSEHLHSVLGIAARYPRESGPVAEATANFLVCLARFGPAHERLVHVLPSVIASLGDGWKGPVAEMTLEMLMDVALSGTHFNAKFSLFVANQLSTVLFNLWRPWHHNIAKGVMGLVGALVSRPANRPAMLPYVPQVLHALHTGGHDDMLVPALDLLRALAATSGPLVLPMLPSVENLVRFRAHRGDVALAALQLLDELMQHGGKDAEEAVLAYIPMLLLPALKEHGATSEAVGAQGLATMQSLVLRGGENGKALRSVGALHVIEMMVAAHHSQDAEPAWKSVALDLLKLLEGTDTEDDLTDHVPPPAPSVPVVTPPVATAHAPSTSQPEPEVEAQGSAA